MGVDHPNMDIMKYADDTVYIERLSNNAPSAMEVQFNNETIKWCDTNCIITNSTKTKNMLITNTRCFPAHPPLQVHAHEIE